MSSFESWCYESDGVLPPLPPLMTFEEFQRRWVSARLSQYPIAPAPIPSMPLPLLPPAPPKPNYEVERLKSLNRGGWRCQYCRTKATEVDHVVPRSEGGPDWSWNLVAACGDCNKAAGDLLFPNVEAKRRYIRWVRFGEAPN